MPSTSPNSKLPHIRQKGCSYSKEKRTHSAHVHGYTAAAPVLVSIRRNLQHEHNKRLCDGYKIDHDTGGKSHLNVGLHELRAGDLPCQHRLFRAGNECYQPFEEIIRTRGVFL